MISLSRIVTILAAIILTGSLSLGGTANSAVLAQDDGTPASEESPPEALQPEPSPDPTPVEPPLPDHSQTESTESGVETESAVEGDTDQTASDQELELVETGQIDEPAPGAETPTPGLTFAFAKRGPECLPDASLPAAVESGGFVEYQCRDRMSIEGGDLDQPVVAVDWSARLRISRGWTVRVLPPVSERVPSPEWSAEGGPDVVIDWSGEVALSGEPAALAGEAELAFRVRVYRPACDTTPTELMIEREASVMAGDVLGEDRSPESAPVPFSPELADIPMPSVRFAGPLTFAAFSLDSTGLAGEVRTGALELSVEGLAASCGAWSVHMSAAGMANDGGSPLGGQLIVVGVNGDVVPGGECDLANGCDLLDILAGSASESLEMSVEIQLRAPVFPETGQFQTTITANVVPASG